MKHLFVLLISCLLLSGCQQETLADKIDTEKVSQMSEEIIQQATKSAVYKETEKQITESIKENLKKKIEEF